jgi:hypothetical protein
VTHEREQERRLELLEAAVKALAAALDQREVLGQLAILRADLRSHNFHTLTELAKIRQVLQDLLAERDAPVGFRLTFSDPIPEK